MVFENIVGYLLDKYLGDYIENLDTKKLKVDLWTGHVALENLYLKPNALADLQLPVTISIGYLQRLELQVPWKNIYAQPTKATVDGLYLLVVPKTEVEYDAMRDEKEQHEAKMREVHKIEELQKQKEAEKSEKETEKTNDTLTERIQLQIIRNLELTIRDIHIVYEDRSTKPEHPFAAGITLHDITFQTTTANWQPTTLNEDTPLIHKLGKLSGISMYWNTNAKSRSHLSRDEAIKNLKQNIATDNEHAPIDISYILRPMNINAKIVLAMKPREQQFKQPMFDIKIELDEISLNLNNAQYSDVLNLLEFQEFLNTKTKYIKYHSKVAQAQNLTIRKWKFAYEAIVSEEVRPRFDCYKWENIKAHLYRCREYRKLHILELTGKITVEQKQQAEELEKKLDVFNLTHIRRVAGIEAKKQKNQEPKTWWGSVSGWWSGNKPTDEPELDLEKVMTADEKKKLYDAIGYEGEDISTSSYPETYVDIDLSIRLKLLDINAWAKVNDNDSKFRIVARAVIPETGLICRRRPATDAIALFVDMGSFQVFGMSTDFTQPDLSIKSRPIIAQPTSSIKQGKLLQIEFETKPLNKLSDYRVKILSQSLEIKYNAPTINKLAESFQQDTQRNLEGVKQAAYSTYAEVKNRSFILMKHNIEKIKVLDIDINLQSTYFLLPENGVYEDGGAAICMDLGHLTVERGETSDTSSDILAAIKEAKNIEDARKKSYTKFKLKLEDIQLIYANRNESWETARQEKSTRLHLIKPMELDLDLGKCFYSDDANLPAWTVNGNIPNIDMHLSDNRLFQILNHIQSIPFPESKAPQIGTIPNDTQSMSAPISYATTEQIMEAVESMTPVKKTKEKVAAEENKGLKEVINESKTNQENELTQLEAKFTLGKIDVHINEAVNEDNSDKPFLRLTLETIVATTYLKTHAIDFQASLTDFIVYHQQFIDKDNHTLRLLSAQLNKGYNDENRKLVEVMFLHTSHENPLFSSPPYNGIENQANVHFSKLVITLQLEALLSILRFQDSLMQKLTKPVKDDSIKKIQDQEEKENKALEENKNANKVVKKNDPVASPSLKINANLEEFRIILASKQAQIFDIQVQGVKANVSQAQEKTLVNLILSDLRISDPFERARYKKIISQKGDDKDLLRVDLSLFNYAEGYIKPNDVYDCDVKVEFAKANIVFLFKHIDAMLSFLDSLNVTKAALDLASTKADAAYEQVQKLQEQAFKVHLDITFNAPNIIVPTNSYSDEALFLDLGKLTMKTRFFDDPKRFLVEQQNIQLENILASRVKLDYNYNILGEAVLLECAELNTLMNRLLFPDKVKTEPGVSIKVEWESVHFRLAKDDYACVMKVLMENFSENIRDQISASSQNGHFRYIQEAQEQVEEDMRQVAIKKRKELVSDEILPTMKIKAEIKTLALTLYLGQSDMTVRQSTRNENFKLANIEIQTFEALFRQQSDGSYKAVARVKDFLLDDLRASNKPGSVTRMMDRHFTVDPNIRMLVASFDFKPKSASNPVALRELNTLLESLYICISLDYLMTLQDFFLSGFSSSTTETQGESLQKSVSKLDIPESDNRRRKSDAKPQNAPGKQTKPANVDNEVETRMEILIKHPEVILLEDQHNSNSNCLVLDLALKLRMSSTSQETKLYGWLQNLTVYSSNFAELKSKNNSASKVKYRILQPAKADVFLTMNNDEQKIDLRISDIIISIAPAAVRTVIGVTSSLGTLESVAKDEKEKLNLDSLFLPKPFKDSTFWFIKDFEKKRELNALSIEKAMQIETVTPQKAYFQQLILALESVELKLEVGLGSVTKSVVAMRLSNLVGDVKNWSSNMTLTSTLNVEAALLNENTHVWEPFIEPAVDPITARSTPWCMVCTIQPGSASLNTWNNPIANEKEHKAESSAFAKPKQVISIKSDELLNITLTKTGLNLVQRLSALFNDVYNKRLPPSDDDDQPMLSIFNATGRELLIEHFHGLEVLNKPGLQSVLLRPDQSIPLNVINKQQEKIGLSVIEEPNLKNHQEFSVKIGDVVKTINIDRSTIRVYDIEPSLNSNWPIELLSHPQTDKDRRRVVLGTIVRIFNNTSMPLFLLNVDVVNPKIRKVAKKLDVNQDYYVPIDILYKYPHSSVFISAEEDGDDNDFFSFDWDKEYATEKKIQMKNGEIAYFCLFKELFEAFQENADQQKRCTFHLYVQPSLHLTNLLPIDVQCSVKDDDNIFDLKSNQCQLLSNGGKNSSLIFIIPSYNNIKWISEPVDLRNEGFGDHNEHLVVFNNEATLRMILRVDAYHESFRLLLYSPYWLINRTNFPLEFQLENENIQTSIDTIDKPYLICPERMTGDSNKKGQLRLIGFNQEPNMTDWSEKFPLDVIKNIDIASCKRRNDTTYMICVDIVTCSFGTTKVITFLPSMMIINKSSISIDFAENMENEQHIWNTVEPDKIVPFWPRKLKNALMCVRYTHNNEVKSKLFLMNQKHRTLLHMDDEEHPVLHVEVMATSFDGVKVIFSDYKIGDAPLLVVNCLTEEAISLCQVDDVRTQVLPPLSSVYFTWEDPVKARTLVALCGSKNLKIEYNLGCGSFGKDGNRTVKYTVFIDGLQTVLLFSDDDRLIEDVSGTPSLAKPMDQSIEICINDIGISIVNDIKQEEIIYMSLNKSKVVWTETKKSRAKALPFDVNNELEEVYISHIEKHASNLDDKEILKQKYQTENYREIIFTGNTAQVVNSKGREKTYQRRAMEGLSIIYLWSAKDSALHLRINRVQIDNQLDHTLFPVMLHPVNRKASGKEVAVRPFIEFSVYQSKTTQSNVVQFKYFKLLIQEFAVKIDQGLIVAGIHFAREENISAAPTVNMEADIEYINKPLDVIVRSQIDTPVGETEMYFDEIHLSPLKIHVSFSMHGSNPSEELLAEIPFLDFILQTLNVAEVQDAILRLGYFERKNEKFTMTRMTKDVTSYYQNQFLKQIHVLLFGLDILGNPFGVIRGVAEGVESFFYEPYKGAVEGPLEFAEGVATGVRSLVGSTFGGAAGAFSKVTGVVGKGLATLTFDEEYKASRIQRKQYSTSAASELAISSKGVLTGFVEGFKGVVTKPIEGAREKGAVGFFKGLGKGTIGLVARPTGGIVDFASTSFDVIRKTTQQEEIVRRVRYPRRILADGTVPLYISHEAMGIYILNRLEQQENIEQDTYLAHITCSDSPLSWLMATSNHILFITEISLLGQYELDWVLGYDELKEIPTIKLSSKQIQILIKEPKRTGTIRSHETYGKTIKYQQLIDAQYLVSKITTMMRSSGFTN